MFIPNLKINSEDMPEYAIVCGDPGRAKWIADKLDDAKELAFNRAYRTFVGNYKGVRMAVTSHGVGAPGSAVCFEELIMSGVKTLIRVGTAGSFTKELPVGGLLVCTAAVREEGLTQQLVPLAYPAIADGAVVDALYEKALETGGAVLKGITLTQDAFYQGVMPLRQEQYIGANVIGVEMEVAALLVIASLRGVRAGAIVTMDGYVDDDLKNDYDPHNDTVKQGTERAIDIAIESIRALAVQER